MHAVSGCASNGSWGAHPRRRLAAALPRSSNGEEMVAHRGAYRRRWRRCRGEADDVGDATQWFGRGRAGAPAVDDEDKLAEGGITDGDSRRLSPPRVPERKRDGLMRSATREEEENSEGDEEVTTRSKASSAPGGTARIRSATVTCTETREMRQREEAAHARLGCAEAALDVVTRT
jgi:hypothetical protein